MEEALGKCSNNVPVTFQGKPEGIWALTVSATSCPAPCSASGELVWAELIIKYGSILIIPLDLFEFALREVRQTLFGVKNEK